MASQKTHCCALTASVVLQGELLNVFQVINILLVESNQNMWRVKLHLSDSVTQYKFPPDHFGYQFPHKQLVQLHTMVLTHKPKFFLYTTPSVASWLYSGLQEKTSKGEANWRGIWFAWIWVKISVYRKRRILTVCS